MIKMLLSWPCILVVEELIFKILLQKFVSLALHMPPEQRSNGK